MLLIDLPEFHLTLVNTHFNTAFNLDWGTRSIYHQKLMSNISKFHTVLRQVKQSNLIIASGDFNIQMKCLLFEKLTNLPDLINVFSGEGTTFHQEFLKSDKEPLTIDYIFVYGKQDRYSVTQHGYLFKNKVKLRNNKYGFLSDHIGLKMSILIK